MYGLPDEDRLEEYREQARIEKAIKSGKIVECNSCGTLCAPGKLDEDDPLIEYGPLCKRCRAGLEANLGI